MKYNDRHTSIIKTKYQSKEDYSISDRELRRKRKKKNLSFWSRNLKGYLSEDFWNALSLSEQDSVFLEFITLSCNPIDKEWFAKKVKQGYKHLVSWFLKN